MNSRVHFWIEHEPVAQPRPRFVRRGAFVKAISNPKGSRIEKFKAAARAEAEKAFAGIEPMHGPLRLHATFILPRPKSMKGDHCERHIKRPDIDNLLKGLKDSMTGVCWLDDKQVCAVSSSKWYAAKGEKPGVIVEVEELKL